MPVLVNCDRVDKVPMGDGVTRQPLILSRCRGAKLEQVAVSAAAWASVLE